MKIRRTFDYYWMKMNPLSKICDKNRVTLYLSNACVDTRVLSDPTVGVNAIIHGANIHQSGAKVVNLVTFRHVVSGIELFTTPSVSFKIQNTK